MLENYKSQHPHFNPFVPVKLSIPVFFSPVFSYSELAFLVGERKAKERNR